MDKQYTHLQTGYTAPLYNEDFKRNSKINPFKMANSIEQYRFSKYPKRTSRHPRLDQRC